MPGTSATANLSAATHAPHTGVYVVSHRNPHHALPHEVAIVAPLILPKCKRCDDVRFSLKGLLAQPIGESEFFNYYRALALYGAS